MTGIKKWLVWIFNVMLYIVVAVWVLSMLQGYKWDISLHDVKIHQTGGIFIDSYPEDVSVAVDGEVHELSKHTKSIMNIDPKSVDVLISAEHYISTEFRLKVKASLVSQVFNIILPPQDWIPEKIIPGDVQLFIHPNQPTYAEYKNNLLQVFSLDGELPTLLFTKAIPGLTHIIWNKGDNSFAAVYSDAGIYYLLLVDDFEDTTFKVIKTEFEPQEGVFISDTILALSDADGYVYQYMTKTAELLKSSKTYPNSVLHERGIYYYDTLYVYFKAWNDKKAVPVNFAPIDGTWQRYNNMIMLENETGTLLVSPENHVFEKYLSGITSAVANKSTIILGKPNAVFELTPISLAYHAIDKGPVQNIAILNSDYYLLGGEDFQLCRYEPYYCVDLQISEGSLIRTSSQYFGIHDDIFNRTMLFYFGKKST